MMVYYDEWTGKPLDGPRIPDRQSSETCEHCGTELIMDCSRCGAPNCCPKCCSTEAAALAAKEGE